MIFKEPLNIILGQLSKIKILRFLVKTGIEANGREIARATGLSHVKCHSVLQELSKQGIVKMRSSGKSLLYSLEEQNIVVKSILTPLFESENKLLDMLAKNILSGISIPKPLSIVIFGSVVRSGIEDAGDIDALVIFPDKKDIGAARKEMRNLESNLSIVFGTRFSPVIMKADEVKRRLKAKEHLLTNIAREGRVIYGKTLPEVLRNGK